MKITIKRECLCGYLYKKTTNTNDEEKFMKGQAEFRKLICPKCQMRFIRDGKIIL